MWRCFVITEKKYYLVFKKSSNEMYKFDTVVATDGRGKVLFGKYKGSTIEDIAKTDREYLEWIAETIEDKPDLCWNIRRVLDSV